MTSCARSVHVAGSWRDDAPTFARAIDRVVDSGWFVLGPEVEAFEAEFAAASGAAHAVGVGTGTDAIALMLRALGIGPGDEVITTPLSAAYTALAVDDGGRASGVRRHRSGPPDARPRRIARAVGPRTRAILPVHLYGQPADMDALARVAARHGLALVEDCCQAHLATARAAGRHDRRGGRVQLLPDQESRRARRRRRDRHQRSGARRTQ